MLKNITMLVYEDELSPKVKEWLELRMKQSGIKGKIPEGYCLGDLLIKFEVDEKGNIVE